MIRGALVAVLLAGAMAYDTTTLAACSSCPNGCRTCSGSACSSCKAGYELVSSTSSCSPYPCSVTACSLCNAAGQCLSCTDPYSLYSSSSNSCVSSCLLSHCQRCKAGSLSCEQCQSGYSLYSWDGSCQPTQIQNCLRVHDWRNNQFQCETCRSGYRPTADQLQCMASTCLSLPNCLSCSTNSSLCQSCRGGYSVVSSSCAPNSCTMANCLYCSAPPAACLKCASGYQLSGSACVEQSCGMENCQKCKKGSIFCDLCKDEYVYNVWTHVCEAVETTPKPQNCQSMMRNGRYFKCIGCKTGYVFADANQVKCIQQCPSNCLACSTVTTCTNCSSGYLAVGGSCLALPCSVPGCSLCNSAGGCISCSDPYSLFSSSQGACTPSCLLPHCQTCLSGSSTCQQCLQGYALSSWSNTCSLSLISRCVQFHDWPGWDFFCSRCSLSFKPSSDQLSCIQISCSAIQNCEYCPNSTICSTCSFGYSAAVNGQTCTVNPCSIQNCLLCNSAGQCVKSNSEHYVVGDSMHLITCALPGCSSCKLGSSFCEQCSTGFQLNIWTNQCDGAAPVAESQLKYLWFLVVAVIIVAVVILVKCLKKNTEVALEEEPAAGDTSGQNMPKEERHSLNDENREGGELFGTSMSALQVGQFQKPPNKQRSKLPPLPSHGKEEVRSSSAQLASPSPVITLQRQELVDDPEQGAS